MKSKLDLITVFGKKYQMIHKSPQKNMPLISSKTQKNTKDYTEDKLRNKNNNSA